MPISKYFSGNGEKVLGAMEDTYKDPKKAKSVFYATANKQKQEPDADDKPKLAKAKKFRKSAKPNKEF